MSWWEHRVREGLYGIHGHVFHMGDCDLCDLVAAATSAVGEDAIDVSQGVLDRAASQARQTPADALP